MSREEFRALVDMMIEMYGVRSYKDNEDDEDLWFECCECGEPILYDDWSDLEIQEDEDGGAFIVCPICEERIYLD